jgi:hypothetical protein
MTIRRSTDDGKSWSSQILLDSMGGAYSSLVMVDENHLGILYESSVADMIFQKIPLSDFKQATNEPLIQNLYADERFPNIVVSKKGTLVATWGNKHIRARRSTDAGLTWGPEITIAKPGFHGGLRRRKPSALTHLNLPLDRRRPHLEKGNPKNPARLQRPRPRDAHERARHHPAPRKTQRPSYPTLPILRQKK